MVTPKSVVETTPLVVAWFKQRERAPHSPACPAAPDRPSAGLSLQRTSPHPTECVRRIRRVALSDPQTGIGPRQVHALQRVLGRHQPKPLTRALRSFRGRWLGGVRLLVLRELWRDDEPRRGLEAGERRQRLLRSRQTGSRTALPQAEHRRRLP